MIDPPARLPPIAVDALPEAALPLFGVLTGIVPGQSSSAQQLASPVLRTFAHHPALTKPFLEFNLHILAATSLTPRLRQLAIQRTAWLRRARYIWTSHLRVSLPLGFTRADFDALKAGPEDKHWSGTERTVLRAVDEVVTAGKVSDVTWPDLQAALETKQIMDLLFTAGCYTTLGMVFNTFGIEREPELMALAEEYGAP